MNALGLSLVLLASLASPDAGVPEPTAFSSHVRPERVQVGQPFVYELVIAHPAGHRYELRPWPEPSDFEVLGVERQRRDDAGGATTTFEVKLSAFQLGHLTLPDLTFDVFAETGTHPYVAKGIAIEVVSSLPPDAEEKGAGLHDIRPPEPVAVRTYRLLYALGGALALAALGYALWQWLRRPRPQTRPAGPPAPLHVRTLSALDALRAEDLPGQGRGREFHFRLSEILRGYLGERYGFDALECTTSELLESLRNAHTPGLPFEALTRWAQESDLVKFAKAPADPDACKAALELAYRVVQSTTPPAVPAAASAQVGG